MSDIIDVPSNEELNAEDYRAAVQAVIVASQVLAVHDFERLLEAIDRADSIGPLLDPTLWRDKHKAMEEDKVLFRLALPLARLGQTLSRKG